jgi:hypothetical protein
MLHDALFHSEKDTMVFQHFTLQPFGMIQLEVEFDSLMTIIMSFSHKKNFRAFISMEVLQKKTLIA